MTATLRSVAAAFSYFTTIPIGRFAKLDAPDAFSLSFLPFVGALVGAVAGWTLHGVAMRFGPGAAAVASALVLVALTGSIHIDGFLDCCDALLASVSPSRRLEILKDPRHGTYAVVGMTLLAAAWVVALFAGVAANAWTLAIACAGARCAAIVNAWVYPYARGGAVTAAFESRPNAIVVAASAAALTVAAWFCFGVRGPIALGLALALSLLVARWAAIKLGGGLVGDVYGCIVSLLEPALVLMLVLLPVAP